MTSRKSGGFLSTYYPIVTLSSTKAYIRHHKIPYPLLPKIVTSLQNTSNDERLTYDFSLTSITSFMYDPQIKSYLQAEENKISTNWDIFWWNTSTSTESRQMGKNPINVIKNFFWRIPINKCFNTVPCILVSICILFRLSSLERLKHRKMSQYLYKS